MIRVRKYEFFDDEKSCCSGHTTMSYDCIRDWADETYHAGHTHDCCGDIECERVTRRWWGKEKYANGVDIAPMDNGIWTDAELFNYERRGIRTPEIKDMYSYNGVKVHDWLGRVKLRDSGSLPQERTAPIDIVVAQEIGQGSVRP